MYIDVNIYRKHGIEQIASKFEVQIVNLGHKKLRNGHSYYLHHFIILQMIL